MSCWHQSPKKINRINMWPLAFLPPANTYEKLTPSTETSHRQEQHQTREKSFHQWTFDGHHEFQHATPCTLIFLSKIFHPRKYPVPITSTSAQLTKTRSVAHNMKHIKNNNSVIFGLSITSYTVEKQNPISETSRCQATLAPRTMGMSVIISLILLQANGTVHKTS